MRPLRWLALPALALTAACASSTWTVDHYETSGADLAGKSTFAWLGGELGSVQAVSPSVAAATDQHIRDTVVAGLVRKGYTQVPDAGTADMLVSYQIVGTRKYVTTERPRFGAPLPDDVLMQSNTPPPAASELPREQRFTDGSVIVFVDEPGTERLLWRGMVTAETRVGSKEAGIHTAAEMARDIVDTFPQRRTGP
jgi:hypothetical protein